jgi:hypothetical protein
MLARQAATLPNTSAKMEQISMLRRTDTAMSRLPLRIRHRFTQLIDTPGNGVPGVQTGGTAIDGTPDTRGITEKTADTLTATTTTTKPANRLSKRNRKSKGPQHICCGPFFRLRVCARMQLFEPKLPDCHSEGATATVESVSIRCRVATDSRGR